MPNGFLLLCGLETYSFANKERIRTAIVGLLLDVWLKFEQHLVEMMHAPIPLHHTSREHSIRANLQIACTSKKGEFEIDCFIIGNELAKHSKIEIFQRPCIVVAWIWNAFFS